jgi:hypothetical protein
VRDRVGSHELDAVPESGVRGSDDASDLESLLADPQKNVEMR